MSNLPVWAMGYALREAGVPCAEEVAMMLGKVNKTAASMYLYGTPSDSGNIGLRSGDTVTYYDGAVLPRLPEWDKEAYPYAVITEYTANANIHHLIVSKNPLTVQSDGYIGRGYDFKYVIGGDLYGDEEWYKSPNTMLITDKKIVWANYDIYDADNTLCLTKSNPIPVSGLVGYSYNGTVLPVLPEWDKTVYPYAVIGTLITRDVALRVCKSVSFKNTYVENPCPLMYWKVVDDEWVYSGEINSSFEGEDTVVMWTVYWSNHDILNEDGTVYKSASDPIPIYE